MTIFAIDPGNTHSGYVICDQDFNIKQTGKIDNDDLLTIVTTEIYDVLVIEMIASYGMAVGKEVFDTCVWIGRFKQASGKPTEYIYRKEEKLTLCGSMKANDSNIRRALIDLYAQHDFKNGKGTKANPDKFYKVSKDMWSACAVAVTWIEKKGIGGVEF